MTEPHTQESSIPDYPKGITFEQVWAMFQESDRKFEISRKEAELRSRDAEQRSKEADRRLQKLEEQVEKTGKQVGGLGNSIGGLVETLFAARLWEKFSSYNYGFKRVFQQMPVYETNSAKMPTDIDILLSDTEWAMAVEVKRKMKKEDVEDHVERMNRILKHPPAEVKGKKLLGAMAGGTIDPEALNFAYETGFCVLELKGESMELLTPPEGFEPTEW